ncbi:glycine betaine ABC transporter substrate-binding protein [Methanosalsum natronophilum]|uniref:glycine betaine ABC transporter substrate-binding protein n=1 Tax=Methanosalsum natronophilum TaxID=768733 RepID=UPI00286DCB4C|nr:glycine betaine ABC transporter substrate-binding protein [Methanosalsum natronophilum]MCS3924918.1 glycine betaine/proline transport system substrate-binding protein [Methanosalsum natronophilum]
MSIIGIGCLEDTEVDPYQTTTEYLPWDGEIASTNVLKIALEDAGYDVEIISIELGALYRGLADGQFDFTVSAWLPHTHGHYIDQYGDDFEEVSVNLEGWKIGLVVPEYVTIDSVEELNDHKDEFDGRIVGIEPGAGLMSATEDAIDTYGLYHELVASSGAAMTTELRTAIQNEEWVVVTGWSPHWKFQRWDLKYLDDPEGSFGAAEYVGTLAREGLQEDKPELYEIISRFEWEQEYVESVMMDMEEGMDPEDAAAKWIEDNPEKVASCFEE